MRQTKRQKKAEDLRDDGENTSRMDQSARDTTKALSKAGIIASDTAKSPWRLAFPAALAPRLTPGLFPDRK
jgi:hypothetical protein